MGMCKLFGISSRHPVSLNETLAEFYAGSADYPNGWGLALFYGNSVSLEKEPAEASVSQYLKARLKHEIWASCALAHMRKGSVGEIDYANCHPFVHRDNYNRSWTMIHSGATFDCPALNSFITSQDGTTDSERILLYLLSKINLRQNALGRALEPQERFGILDDFVAEIAEGNMLTFLLYDGEYMYIHNNVPGSLYMCSRHAGHRMFSTQPMALGSWEEVPFTRLCVCDEGRIIHTGKNHGFAYTPDPAAEEFLYRDFSCL